MPTREEMRSLAEEIVGSYADRVATVAQLRETVKMDLKGFQDSRTAMGKELRADLAKSVADRKAAVNTKLKELDAAHTAMSREMRAELNKGRQTLTEEEVKRQSEAREFMGRLGRAVAEGKAAVKTLLGEFDSAHTTMSKEMRAELAKSVTTLKHEVGAMLKGFNAELKEVRSELAGGRDEWQKLTATMQSKRGGVAVAVKPPVEEIAEEAAEITPETADIRDRVFEYLANHPDGTKMTGLEEKFRLARIQIAKIVKSLIDENKVEKRELFYFAI